MPHSYCATLVRTHDYDHYLCALFAPVHVRETWFALFAFNYEIAAIAERVNEEMAGLLRFAWWREALDQIYAGGAVPHHPVVEALARVVREHHLPRALFDTMLAARAEDVYGERFTDFAALEQYCRDTSSGLLQLCASVAGVPATPALESLGVAWALIAMARLKEGDRTELLHAAATHLKAVQQMQDSLPLFMPFAQVCEFYLNQLQKSKSTHRLLLVLTLWRKNLFSFR